jgi:hypothetical protein
MEVEQKGVKPSAEPPKDTSRKSACPTSRTVSDSAASSFAGRFSLAERHPLRPLNKISPGKKGLQNESLFDTNRGIFRINQK